MSDAALTATHGSELYVRHARKDDHSVALLRALDRGDCCVVEATVWPNGSGSAPVARGPYTFPSAVEATRFVTHAVEAFIALGCEVGAS
jgi:hypothetical protein